MQKLEIKLIDRKVAKEELTDGQSNLLFSNQAHALDGAILGTILPCLRDTRTFLLLNHRKFFQRPQIALALQARAILLVFEKIYSCLFIPNCTRNHLITIQIYKTDIIPCLQSPHPLVLFAFSSTKTFTRYCNFCYIL